MTEAKLAILRISKTCAVTGDSRSSHYDKVAKRLMTKPVHISGGRAVGWLEHEVQAVTAARVAGYSDDQVRELVVKLEACRINLLEQFVTPYLTSGQGIAQSMVGPADSLPIQPSCVKDHSNEDSKEAC